VLARLDPRSISKMAPAIVNGRSKVVRVELAHSASIDWPYWDRELRPYSAAPAAPGPRHKVGAMR
jgi:hypothetical protein